MTAVDRVHEGGTVAVLLSTYNGARFLVDQLESVRSQTYPDWSMWVRDDGSSDDTVSILQRYVGLDDRIHILSDDGDRLGSCHSFGRLLEGVTADYLLFCDQDDIWLTDKIDRLISEIKALEHRLGSDHPLLVHSDLLLMGPDGNTWDETFMSAQKLHPLGEEPLKSLLVQNVVTGCACMMNRALRTLAVPFPREAVMHDWWVALVAGAAGTIHFVEVPTVRYRLHEGNVIGLGRPFSWKSLRVVARWTELRRQLDRAIEQAAALERHLSETVSSGQRLDLTALSNLDGGGLRSLSTLARRGVRKQGFYRNALLYLLALTPSGRRS